ncbi:MAG: His/Gly/Thr/Pro-type tRNA ligase C-terminal domain-containing protein, partial [Bdellovibrionota bacterium]
LPKPELRNQAEAIARELRKNGTRWDGQPLRVITPLSVDGFGTQLKQAAKHGARAVVLLGDDELKMGQVLLKDLKTGVQVTLAITNITSAVTRLLGDQNK